MLTVMASANDLRICIFTKVIFVRFFTTRDLNRAFTEVYDPH